MTRGARPRGRRRGQATLLIAASMTVMLGFVGLVIDVGRLYYASRALQASTDAAALAGAATLPGATAAAKALAYSSVAGKLNAYGNLPGVTMAAGYPLVKCLSSVASEGIPCVAPTNGNSIVVKQQVAVPMTFAALVGVRPITLTAMATAAKGGTVTPPLNVAVLLDTTASMNNNDNDCGGKARVTCALQAAQSLLSGLSPCPMGRASCGAANSNSSGGGGNVADAVDRVSLHTFPANTAASASNNYTCRGQPSVVPYTFAGAAPGFFQPAANTYQVVNWSSDYRSSNSAGLNAQSDIVAAVGASTQRNGCMKAVGGVGTYYAQAIYQTQAALAAQGASSPGSQSVLIMLSDGDANANKNKMQGTLNANGVYPSASRQCQQAITAAQAAQAAGTLVYTIAYGAASSGCSTDTGGLTPCTTLQRMASGPTYFFSDASADQNKNQCVSASRPITNLNQIFKQIAGELTVARLIPDNAP
jgi:Flp pilus assembly protein TadG